jgi:hypothetical protein
LSKLYKKLLFAEVGIKREGKYLDVAAYCGTHKIPSKTKDPGEIISLSRFFFRRGFLESQNKILFILSFMMK